MPNWNYIVREHIAALRLPPEREIEIVEEMAPHLEAAYEDALADGLSEAEAEARAVQIYERAANIALYNEILRRARRLNGVADFAATNSAPLSGDLPLLPVEMEGHPFTPGQPVTLLWAGAVTPEYFQLMRIPLLSRMTIIDRVRECAARSVARLKGPLPPDPSFDG